MNLCKFKISFGNMLIIGMLWYLIYLNHCKNLSISASSCDYLKNEAISKFVSNSLDTSEMRHGLIVSDIYPIGNLDGLYLVYAYIENAAPPAANIYIIDYTGYIYNPPGIGPHALQGMEALGEPFFYAWNNQLNVTIEQYYRDNKYNSINFNLTPYIDIYANSENGKKILNRRKGSE